MNEKGDGAILPLLIPDDRSDGMAHRLSAPQPTQEIPAEQVRRLTTDLLGEYLPLGLAGARYRDADIFNVVVAAAAQGRSIASVCQQ